MKIYGKSELILNALRRMSKVAVEPYNNYRFVAKDYLEIYTQSSSVYCKCSLIEIEVEEPGEVLAPITLLTLIPNFRNIELFNRDENIIIKAGKTEVSARMNFDSPDIIPIIEDKVDWSKETHSRLVDISYACSSHLNYTSCLWFMNGGALSSDGVNTATYRAKEVLPIDKLGLDAALLNKFGYEGEFRVYENKGSIWLGNELGYSVMPSSNFLMPPVLEQFVGVKEENLSSAFTLNMDEIKSFLPSIIKLSENNNKHLCVIQADGDNFNIIPQGNSIGNGNYNFTVLESLNKMLLAVNPKALVKAFSACGKGVKTIGIYNVPGFTEMLTIIDNEITHFITPMLM